MFIYYIYHIHHFQRDRKHDDTNIMKMKKRKYWYNFFVLSQKHDEQFSSQSARCRGPQHRCHA